jgi:hypothetical protein
LARKSVARSAETTPVLATQPELTPVAPNAAGIPAKIASAPTITVKRLPEFQLIALPTSINLALNFN